LEVDLISVIFVYLLTVVGPTAFTSAGPYFIPGGPLGVSGNIVLAKLAFAVEMEEIETKLSTITPSLSFVEKSLSGDDFAFLLLVKCVDRELAISHIKSKIIETVGNPKEFVVEIMSDQPNDFISGSTFCKKKVIVNQCVYETGTTVHIKSQQKLPFMSELITASTKYQRCPGESIASFKRSLEGVITDKFEDRDDFINGYLACFITAHKLEGIHYDVRKTYVLLLNQLVFQENLAMTENVKLILSTMVPLFLSNGREIRPSIKEKLDELQAKDIIVFRKIRLETIDGGEVRVAISLKELKKLPYIKNYVQVSPIEPSICGTDLTNIFIAARDSLGVNK
jgi:hypothetical protein